MGFRIRCGGYKTPFDPFKRADGTIVCTPEGQDLSLWCSKLAPKQQDQWLAAASWTSTEGDRVGAMAWRGKNDAGTVDRGDIYWDKDPLPYDPRPEGDRESWGEHRPRYGGNGWWTGAVFSDARDVEISNPADVSATTYQLAPGATIVPQLAAPYYGGGSFGGQITGLTIFLSILLSINLLETLTTGERFTTRCLGLQLLGIRHIRLIASGKGLRGKSTNSMTATFLIATLVFPSSPLNSPLVRDLGIRFSIRIPCQKTYPTPMKPPLRLVALRSQGT